MAFADYVQENREKVFQLAEQNKKEGRVVSTLYDEWQKEEKKSHMLNIY